MFYIGVSSLQISAAINYNEKRIYFGIWTHWFQFVVVGPGAPESEERMLILCLLRGSTIWQKHEAEQTSNLGVQSPTLL